MSCTIILMKKNPTVLLLLRVKDLLYPQQAECAHPFCDENCFFFCAKSDATRHVCVFIFLFPTFRFIARCEEEHT